MYVGALQLVVHIPSAHSLKDRRRVVRKLKDRIRARLPVSVCELDAGDRWQIGILGISCVAKDAVECRALLERVRAMAETLGDCWLSESNGEVIGFGDEGQNLRGGIEAAQNLGIFDEVSKPLADGLPHEREDRLDAPARCGDSRPVSRRPKRLQVVRKPPTRTEKK